jgi:plastocyanin
MPRPTLSAGALACAVAAALAACGGPAADDGSPPPAPCSSATATETREILITPGQFLPYCAKVPVGALVTFRNADFAEHTVTADAGQPEPFDSGILFPGQEYERAFSSPEIVRVHCRFNPEVSGRVIVE